MLKLTNIRKVYKTGDLVQKALDGVSLSLRKNEFVAVLGPSGSGKTTLLNIIGGLDRYDSGDLVIESISTKDYKDRDWDSYRNHTVGFVFQSYNLIPHQSILANVELALTISGISKGERRKRAKEALEKVGLGDQIHKKPNQMSGGQMQRVAIARALVNNPSILLADEPTGALDSDTSLQVMNLLKEVASDHLVVMVTHNGELAKEYATRIVSLKDGKIVGDSDPFNDKDLEKETHYENMGHSSMSFSTALSLSFNNLQTKKGRTFLTAFAGAIGIIGIALILSLSTGVNKYIEDIQKSTMTSYPVTIETQTFDLSSMTQSHNGSKEKEKEHELDAVYSDTRNIQIASAMTSSITKNNLTEFKKYLDDESSPIHQYIGENGIVYNYNIKFSAFTYDPNGELINIDGSSINGQKRSATFGTSSNGMAEILGGANGSLISNAVISSYDVLYGSWPEAYDEIVFVVNSNNEISASTLFQIGLLPASMYRDISSKIMAGEEVKIEVSRFSYEDLCNKTYYFVPDCDLYTAYDDGTYALVSEEETLKTIVNEALQLKVVGVIRPKEDADYATIGQSLGYTKALSSYVIEYAQNSDVVKAQLSNPDINILTGKNYASSTFKVESLEGNLETFGVVNTDNPTSISLYADSFEAKDGITLSIEEYNKSVEEEYAIVYTDYVALLMSSVTTIINVISYVLIAFVSVSLVVSSIMIGIITYISVLERTKEIGILRAIGASKANVKRVFNAETLIIGFFSGLLGVGITYLLNIPINKVIHVLTDTKNVNAYLPLSSAIKLVFLSMVLTMIGGIIPASKAAKKDPVTALRTE
ncbi:MAG: ABC transporter ATP-binding protein/permease [Sphaerochaetaceae bacterium]|nr:ABC transporter ATP-binding protein/permease [Sphaerochaetaceae bacterium]